MKLTAKLPVAWASENAPVMPAATANWNDTIPDASLSRDSALRMLPERLGISAVSEREATAMGSVGDSAAHSANAAASGTRGSAACTANPMTKTVTMTRPMARLSTGPR